MRRADEAPAPPGSPGLTRLLRFARAAEEPWVLLFTLALATGIASGFLAVGLRSCVHGIAHGLGPLRETAMGIVLPALGGLLGAAIVLVVFREAPGHGVPDVIRAVCRHGGRMRKRSIVSRWLGSLVSVASGGSAGLEGPIVFSGAAAGATIGTWLELDERRRSVLLACGVAGGIAAIFNAPLTGMIFSVEVVLAEWSALSILPVAASAVCATSVARTVLGNQAPFHHPSFAMGVADLGACALLGLVCGLVSVGLTRAVEGVHLLARRVPRGRLAAPFAFGALVGGIGAWIPGAIGEGYDVAQAAISGSLSGGLVAVAALLVAKVVATGLTLGSGAPGGIFAPSLVVGALLGSLFHRASTALLPPSVPLAVEGSYALVGMAGLMAGVMQAPLTGILLVMEVTQGYEVILPLMTVSVFALLVVRSIDRHSVYTRELAESGDLLRPGTDRRILADMTVEESVESDVPTVSEDVPLSHLGPLVGGAPSDHIAVLEGGSGRFLGVLDLSRILDVLLDPDLARVTLVGTVMEAGPPHVAPGDSVADAIRIFERTGARVIPVLDGDRFVGVLSKAGLFDHYRHELSAQAP